MTPPTTLHTQLPARLRWIVQGAWLAVFAVVVVTFAMGVPVRRAWLLRPVSAGDPALFGGMPPAIEALATSRLGPNELAALAASGLPLNFYAGYILAAEVALGAVCAITGALIFWRRSDDWMALWVSLIVVLVGTNGVSLVVPSLAAVWPPAVGVSTLIGMVGMASLIHVVALSPNGRFVPRWMLVVAAGCTGCLVAMAATLLPGNVRALATGAGLWLPPLWLVAAIFMLWGLSLAVGVAGQFYRYRRVSGPVERQQTKWVAAGLAAVTLGILVNAALLGLVGPLSGSARAWAQLARATLVNTCLMGLPVCLAFSILRYRLWDIDVIIRRTLIYSALTAVLALAYLGSVVALQSAFRVATGQTQGTLVVVLSTLAIAALFGPVRARVQRGIDRRFFRRKYDAARTLAGFASAARDETDLDRLSAQLVGVVQETMEPASVGLWLRKDGGI